MLTRCRVRGFTLIEALVALSLMLMGLAGAGLALGRSLQHERESGNRRAALRLAASLADELRALEPDADVLLEPDAGALPAGSSVRVERAGELPVSYLIHVEWPVAGSGMQRLVLPVTP